LLIIPNGLSKEYRYERKRVALGEKHIEKNKTAVSKNYNVEKKNS